MVSELTEVDPVFPAVVVAAEATLEPVAVLEELVLEELVLEELVLEELVVAATAAAQAAPRPA